MQAIFLCKGFSNKLLNNSPVIISSESNILQKSLLDCRLCHCALFPFPKAFDSVKVHFLMIIQDDIHDCHFELQQRATGVNWSIVWVIMYLSSKLEDGFNNHMWW